MYSCCGSGFSRDRVSRLKPLPQQLLPPELGGFQDCGDAHAACRADGNQAAPGTLLA